MTNYTPSSIEYYENFRPSYPKEIFESILHDLPNSHRQQAVDLGSGTGQSLASLIPHFEKIIGVDAEINMIKFAREKFKDFPNVTFYNFLAEDFVSSLKPASIDLITAARSLHWMDLNKVLPKVYEVLKPNGVFASFGDALGGIWKRDFKPFQVIREVISTMPMSDPFVPIKGNTTSLEEILSALKKLPFQEVKQFSFEKDHVWTAKQLIGLFFSTSGLLDWLGKKSDVFEKLALKELEKLNPDDFKDQISFGLAVCIK